MAPTEAQADRPQPNPNPDPDPQAATRTLETVADRIRAFHDDAPAAGLLGSITFQEPGYRIALDDADGPAWIVATALIHVITPDNDRKLVAEGTARHAYPRGGSEVERVQTAAIGRALAAAGYPGATSVESTEGIAAHAPDPDRTLADQDEIKRVLAEAFPRGGDGYQAARLAAIKNAGLPYASVGAALSGMTVAELDQLTRTLKTSETEGGSS